jgi:hypothetical protein
MLVPVFGQIAAPASPAISAPAATAVPVPQKNREREPRKREVQQQQPTATSPPVVNRQENKRPPGTPQRQTPSSQRLGISYAEAKKRQHHERHDRPWWTSHFITIVLVNGQGYYYWDAGYWFPALGYDPQYESYEYNGPIYTYGNLLPDQVIYNVQQALKDLGYYSGSLSGSMSGATINAIGAFQQDNGLEVTGAIDEPTVEALGLY